MKLRLLPLTAGLLILVSCATKSSVSTSNLDDATLKGSPAGISIFGFADFMTPAPGLLGGTYPACVASVVNGATTTLTFTGCPSATGGTLSGNVAFVDTPSGSTHTYVGTYGSLVDTRSATLQWAYSGQLDVVVNGSAATLNTVDGFHITVTDAATPANDKVWTFTCAITSALSSGSYTLQGTFGLVSDKGDNVAVTIAPATPLAWAAGSTWPVSGTMVIEDNRPGQTNRETITAVFDHGKVTLNGGTVNLGTP